MERLHIHRKIILSWIWDLEINRVWVGAWVQLDQDMANSYNKGTRIRGISWTAKFLSPSPF
jgi:hypothetical protein